MIDYSPTATSPNLSSLLTEADIVFKEMNRLLFEPKPDTVKLRELNDRGKELAKEMARFVAAKNPTYSRQITSERENIVL